MSRLLPLFWLPWAIVLFALLCVDGQGAYAACSTYKGLATINEIHDQGVIEYFVEVKPLDNTIPASIYDSWTITICNDSGTCNGPLALGLANHTNYPWLVIGKESVSDPDDPIGDPNLIDVSQGMDVILKDSNGDTIDYVTLNGYTNQQDASCTLAYDWQVNITQSNTNTVQRIPDGTGTFAGAPGGSNPPTDTTTNDQLPDGNTPPSLSLSHVIVSSGQTANFILTLEADAAYDITIDFQTLDDTALVGTDYTATTGTITIPAGTAAGSTVTIPVATLLPPPASDVSFYLFLNNPVNVALPSQFATGTITSSVLILNTKLDECFWAPSSPDVLDSSGNNLHGTATNGLISTDISEEAGGICMAAALDGTNYIEIADSGLLDITANLTVMTWIKPNSIPNRGLKTILSKDENYEFHIENAGLGDGSGRIYWWWQDPTRNAHILNSTATFFANEWVHVTIRFQSGTATILINGQVDNSSSGFPATLRTNNDPLQFGGDQGFAGREFDGRIDEVLIFASAVSNSMVNIIYTNQLAKKNYDGSSRTCNVCGPPADTFVMSTDGNAQLISPSLTFDNNDAVEYSASTSTATILHNIGALFSSGANLVNALHLHPDGHVYFSLSEGSTSTASYGSQTFDADDILEYDPVAGSLSLFFNGDSHFNATDENIDALYIDDVGALYISTTNGANIGGQTINNEDVVQYTVATGTASLYFDGSAHFRNNEDVDGFHIVDANNVLVSTTGNARLGAVWFWGGLTFSDGDVVKYNTATRAPTLFFDESTKFDKNENIDALSVRPPLALKVDHFIITHDGSGITCNTDEINITACQDAACLSQYTGTVDLTLTAYGNTTGATDSIPLSVSGGSTTYALRHTTPEIVTLGITSPVPINANTCLNTATATASCDITFYEAGFIFDVPPQTACKTSTNVTISAVRTDPVTQQCVPALAGGRTETINFWSTYVNPASGTEQVTVNSTQVATSPAGTGVSLFFDSNGESTFTVTYPDAGNLQLDAAFTGTDSETGLVMAGTDGFVVRPAGLCVYSDDVDADCLSGDATCSPFIPAGQVFNLKVKGVCWEVDGEADIEFCNIGRIVTGNFELAGIDVTQNRVAPVTGNNGSLGVTSFDMAAGDDGEHTINQTVSEVGVFTFTADPPAYLGAGDFIPTSTSANVGRFFPDHFNVGVTDGVLQAACGGIFTYTGQPMSYGTQPTITITAMNGAAPAAVTRNYTAGFNKLAAVGILLDGPTQDNVMVGSGPIIPTPMQISSVLNVGSLGDNTDGTLIYDLSNLDNFTYDRDGNALVVPFTPSFSISINSITDSDGVVATTPVPLPVIRPGHAGFEIRYGQARAANVFGSERESLTLPVWAEYLDPTMTWAVNTDDGCSSFSVANFVETGITVTPLAPPSTLIGGRGDFIVTILTDSGAAGGEAQYDFDFPAWLEPDPSGTATFGIYRGNDRIINWREILR